MNMSLLNLNEFFLKCFHLRDGSSLNHCWPKKSAMGSPWALMSPLGLSSPSVNCTGVSVRVRFFLRQNQKLYRLFCEILARITFFPWKTAAVSFNSLEKFYNNGAEACSCRREENIKFEILSGSNFHSR